MANFTAITSWSADDAAHFARRAGFGLGPEAAAALAGQAPGTAIDAWVDGTGLDTTLYDSVLSNRADPVTQPAVAGSNGGTDQPAVAAPHRYLVDGADAWRDNFAGAQASLAFRMQYGPYAFRERMALFFHNLFATGNHKVDNPALMLQQYAMLRANGLGNFADLIVSLSKDPAMCIWLDSVLNNAAGTNIPNENYAREVMELYSLGADNGYSQQDITELAKALSGWSFVVKSSDYVQSPADGSHTIAAGQFALYDGSANPAGSSGYLWDGSGPAANTTNMRVSGTRAQITFLGQAFNVSTAPPGQTPGEDALRYIVAGRSVQCAQFLAKRFLTHFVTARFTQADLDDTAAMIQGAGFDLRAVMKTLLKSQYFFDPANRFALVEGPVSWVVRAARMLGPDLATADGMSPKGFPAWILVAGSFDPAGMKLLDPSGPNGWKEDTYWINTNTIRYRTRLAAAAALAETTSFNSTTYTLFPNNVDAWFLAPPADALTVYNRLLQLLQPAPIPTAVRDAWLTALWPTFTWDATSKNKARELAYLILCSPAGQLY